MFLLLNVFLTVYNIDTPLGLGQPNTVEVVNNSLVTLCVPNDTDSSRLTFLDMRKVLPALRRLVLVYRSRRDI